MLMYAGTFVVASHMKSKQTPQDLLKSLLSPSYEYDTFDDGESTSLAGPRVPSTSPSGDRDPFTTLNRTVSANNMERKLSRNSFSIYMDNADATMLRVRQMSIT